MRHDLGDSLLLSSAMFEERNEGRESDAGG